MKTNKHLFKLSWITIALTLLLQLFANPAMSQEKKSENDSLLEAAKTQIIAQKPENTKFKGGAGRTAGAQLVRNKLQFSEVINVNPPKTNTTQQALADHYLNVIIKVNEGKYFDSDVYDIYKRMEAMKPNNKDLEVLKELREFYIKVLEKDYLKLQQKLRNENK